MTENELKVMRSALAKILDGIGRHEMCNNDGMFCGGVLCSECPFGSDENMTAIYEDLTGESK